MTTDVNIGIGSKDPGLSRKIRRDLARRFRIKYIRMGSNWKYRLAETIQIKTRIRPSGGLPIERDFFRLDLDGTLTVRAGYCWDGPSGPAFDTKTFMRGSLVHDVFYQMIRLGLLPSFCKEDADAELLAICREDGMMEMRVRWVGLALRTFGSRRTTPLPGDILKVLEAP